MHTKRTLFYLVSSRHLSSSSLFRMESRSDISTIGVWIEIAWQHKINVWFFLAISLSSSSRHTIRHSWTFVQTQNANCFDQMPENGSSFVQPNAKISNYSIRKMHVRTISNLCVRQIEIRNRSLTMNTSKWWAWHNRNMSINLLSDVIIEHCGDHSFSAE